MLAVPLHEQRPNLPARSPARNAFIFLFVIAWVCCGALVKWEARWLYLLLGVAVIAALWIGRRQPVVLRLLVLLALVFPVWKKVELRRDRFAADKDAALISALVSRRERC